MPAMSASYPHPIIAREGWPFLAATLVVAVASGWLIGWWSAPIWLAVLFVLQFFRDPPRQAPGDAHTVVSPADGRIVAVENERNALWLRTTRGADVTCVQVAGLIARRILCYVNEGDSLARGQRFGFIRFGSRVDIYVPENADLVAALGDKVYATRSVIATLPHHA
jgi:phosphatidylserine decarboxylase